MTEEAIEVIEESTPMVTDVSALTPVNLLSLVITQGADVDKISAMMGLMERHEKKLAKQSYTLAMAAFKENPPLIVKDKSVSFGNTSYNHASLGQVSQKINSALSKHGLTASWGIDQGGKDVKVICTITHIDGHSESTPMESPPDNSGGKNAIQAIGSTVSYLQRYTILALTGLSTSEGDDDGAAAGYSADHIQAIKISPQEFCGGIDHFKKPKFTSEDLSKWFESKDDSFRLLSAKERAGLVEHLNNAFDWLDKNGKHGTKEKADEPETVKCPESGRQVVKDDCLQSECHKTCKAMGNFPENKLEIDIE